MEPRILFVDDEEFIVTMAAGYLARNGYTVVTAGSVREAMAAYEPETFDLIITDLIMEPENGLVLFSKIREKDPGAKFLLMSGLGENDMVDPLVKSGDAVFLAKPFGIKELREAVITALA